MIEHHPAVDRRRHNCIDQSMIDIGHGQAKVADLARLVTQRLGLVDAAQELGDDQRDTKSYRA